MPSNKECILAIDQGTSSTKSLLFDPSGKVLAKGTEALHTSYLSNGFIEQDPAEIYGNVLRSVDKCIREFVLSGGDITHIKACGISNQRETFVVWDEKGGPLYNELVWQCKRSVKICERLKKEGHEEKIR